MVQDGTAANDVGSAAATAAALLSVANGQQVTGSVFLVGNTTGALGGPDAGHWDVSTRKYDLQSSVLQSAVIASTLGWTMGGWSGCSTQCGTGTEARSVTCHRADAVQVPDISCPQSKPAVSMSCNLTVGCNYAWEAASWSTCSAACGSSSQTRSVICRQSDGSIVADSFCSASGTRPSTSQSCTSHSTCTYSWYAGGWCPGRQLLLLGFRTRQQSVLLFGIMQLWLRPAWPGCSDPDPSPRRPSSARLRHTRWCSLRDLGCDSDWLALGHPHPRYSSPRVGASTV